MMIQRSNHRGLALIEVLVSIVLLTMLAATCMPLLQRAMRVLGDNPQAVASDLQLNLLADQLLENPDKFGIKDVQTIDSIAVDWPDYPELGLVQIQRLSGEVEAAGPSSEGDQSTTTVMGGWLQFTSESGSVVLRWIPSPPKEAS